MFRKRILAAAIALQICAAACAFAAQVIGAENGAPLRVGIGAHTVTFRWGLGPKPDAVRFASLRWRVLGYLLKVHEGGLSGSDQGTQSGGMRRVYFSENKTFESAEFDAGKTYSVALTEAGLYLSPGGVGVTRVKTLSMGPALVFTIPSDFQAQPDREIQAPPLVPLEALRAHPDSYLDRVIAVEGSVGTARAVPRGGRRTQPVAGSYSSADKSLAQDGFELPVYGSGWSGSGSPHQVELIGYFGPKPGRAKAAQGNSGLVDNDCFQELAVLSSSKP